MAGCLFSSANRLGRSWHEDGYGHAGLGLGRYHVGRMGRLHLAGDGNLPSLDLAFDGGCVWTLALGLDGRRT